MKKTQGNTVLCKNSYNTMSILKSNFLSKSIFSDMVKNKIITVTEHKDKMIIDA